MKLNEKQQEAKAGVLILLTFSDIKLDVCIMQENKVILKRERHFPNSSPPTAHCNSRSQYTASPPGEV